MWEMDDVWKMGDFHQNQNGKNDFFGVPSISVLSYRIGE